jgi:2-C-methyl-D-erythritol 4-phosphate cytidylyltransferase
VKRQRARVTGGAPVIEETVRRERLWHAQTPQVFRRALIMRLFERLMRTDPDTEVTDDAAVCERFGRPVSLIESGATNIKVTRREDIPIAEAYLKRGLIDGVSG